MVTDVLDVSAGMCRGLILADFEEIFQYWSLTSAKIVNFAVK